MVKIEVEKLNIYSNNDGASCMHPGSLCSTEIFEFTHFEVEKQKEVSLNLSTLNNIKYYMWHHYELTDRDWKNLKMEKMPGFRINWSYSIETEPERKYFAFDSNPEDDIYFLNNAFNRYVCSLACLLQ